jgi:CheY-like chemotaxis protein
MEIARRQHNSEGRVINLGPRKSFDLEKKEVEGYAIRSVTFRERRDTEMRGGGNGLAGGPTSDTVDHIPSESTGRRILLVDDEQEQLSLYEQALREEGYLVLCARNGKEALRCLEASSFDLVILDVVMPVMDGIEALGKIVSRYRKMPIILHSGYPHYHTDFMTWLADAFVIKSSDVSVLKESVKALLERKLK